MNRRNDLRHLSLGVVPQSGPSTGAAALMISAPLVAAFAFTLALQGQPGGNGLQMQFDAGLPDASNVLPMRPQTPPPILDLTEAPSDDIDASQSSAFGQAASARSGERPVDPRERTAR